MKHIIGKFVVNAKEGLNPSIYSFDRKQIYKFGLKEWHKDCPFTDKYYAIIYYDSLMVEVTKDRYTWINILKQLYKDGKDHGNDFKAFKVEKDSKLSYRTRVYVS